MNEFSISPDDLEDLRELVFDLQDAIGPILYDHDFNIAFSALMSACINCTLGQCETVEEVIMYRNIFIHGMNSFIKEIKLQQE
jgi:hypothetical protein